MWSMIKYGTKKKKDSLDERMATAEALWLQSRT